MMDSCGFVRARAVVRDRAANIAAPRVRARLAGVCMRGFLLDVDGWWCSVWCSACAPHALFYESARRAGQRRRGRLLFMFIARNGFLI